ncbi:MAG: ABC transporter ATP-binding protein [Thermoplasmata archaeon]
MAFPHPIPADGAVLEVHGLSKTYHRNGRGGPAIPANDHLDLTVHRREILALLGPNGAGKSTFLKQVAGQLMPSEGSIRVAGIDMVARPKEAKDRIAVIPQECEPVGSLTVEEHVRYFGRIKSHDRHGSDAKVEDVLGKVGLLDKRGTLVRELSGGLKRRVLIGTALAGDSAELMLLDEPTTGLDPEARRSVWQLIEELRSEGRGILLTTHYIEEAEFLADRLVMIAHGRFVARGTVDEVRHQVQYRGRLDVTNANRLPSAGRSALVDLEHRWPVTLRTVSHVRFGIPDPFSTETVRELEHLSQLGVAAALAPVSLEDAYLELVGHENGGGS